MVDKLEACPFCGGEAELIGFQAPEFWVHCPAIGCKAQTEAFGSKERAIAAWNRRAAANGEQVERDVRPQAEAIATSVADRCQGTRPKGAAPQRYALIWQAARLGAIDALTATLPTPTEDARSRVKVLEEALEAIRDGDAPRPVHCQWRADGKPSKLDKCKHGVTMSEDCTGCTAEFIDTALGNKETDRHG